MKPWTKSSLLIERNKTANIFMMLGSLAFLCLGCWMLIEASSNMAKASGAAHPLTRYMLSNPMLYKGVAVAIVLATVFAIIHEALDFLDKTPGLYADSLGLVDAHYDHKEPLGPILWDDILAINVSGDEKKVLVIEVSSPEKYLAMGNFNRCNNSKRNMDAHGSPIVIPQKSLKDDLDKVAMACKKLQAAHIEKNRAVK